MGSLILSESWPLWQVIPLALVLAAPFVVGALYASFAIRRHDRTGWLGLVVHLGMTIVAIVVAGAFRASIVSGLRCQQRHRRSPSGRRPLRTARCRSGSPFRRPVLTATSAVTKPITVGIVQTTVVSAPLET